MTGRYEMLRNVVLMRRRPTYKRGIDFSLSQLHLREQKNTLSGLCCHNRAVGNLQSRETSLKSAVLV